MLRTSVSFVNSSCVIHHDHSRRISRQSQQSVCLLELGKLRISSVLKRIPSPFTILRLKLLVGYDFIIVRRKLNKIAFQSKVADT